MVTVRQTLPVMTPSVLRRVGITLASLVFELAVFVIIGVMVGPSHSDFRAAASPRPLQTALDRVQKAATPLATGQQINRAADGPAMLISSKNLRAVLAALEAEATTLRRADAVAGAADGVLAEASNLLIDNQGLEVQLANTAGLAAGEAEVLTSQVTANRQAVARLTGNAAFNGVALFDGSMRLRVGGGQLDLPAIAGSVPTQQALATLRGQIGAFQSNVISGRLSVVEATLESTAQTQSMIRDTDFARQTAEFVRAATLADAATRVAKAQNGGPGTLLDVTA